MKLQPLNDRVIVKQDTKEQTTSSGLYLPDSAQEKPLRGKVVAVGPGRRLENGKIQAMDIKVGDSVLYGKYSGTEVTVSGEEFVILREEDVLGIIIGEKSENRGEPVGAGKKGKK